jgi:hypothetical protein
MISQKTAYYNRQKLNFRTLRPNLLLTHLQVGQIHAVFRVMLLAQEQVPQPARLGLFLELLHDGDDGRPSFLEGVFRELGVV